LSYLWFISYKSRTKFQGWTGKHVNCKDVDKIFLVDGATNFEGVRIGEGYSSKLDS